MRVESSKETVFQEAHLIDDGLFFAACKQFFEMTRSKVGDANLQEC